MTLVLNRDYGEKLRERQRSVDSIDWHNYWRRRVQQVYLLCVKVLLRYFSVWAVTILWGSSEFVGIDENEVGVQVKQHMRG